MYPYVHLLGKDISSYMLTAATGFVALLIIAWLITRRRNDIDQTQILHISLASMGGAVIGAHLLYGIVNFRVLIIAAKDGFSQIHSFLEMTELIGSVFGGMVFYGGLAGGIVGTLWYLKTMKMPLSPYLDIMSFCIPLFHGFARIGCFLGGCCYGIESEFGLEYHNAILVSANGVRRFPVQLLESSCNFILFGFLLVMFQKNRLSNRLIYIYLILYSIIRFFDEFLRGDAIRGHIGALSTSQFISVIVLIVSTGVLIKSAHSKTSHTYSNPKKV